MSQYGDCMSSAMRNFPKGITREERSRLFCIHAKLCSHKANSMAEAEKLCGAGGASYSTAGEQTAPNIPGVSFNSLLRPEAKPAPAPVSTPKPRGAKKCVAGIKEMALCMLATLPAEADLKAMESALSVCVCGKEYKEPKVKRKDRLQEMIDQIPADQLQALASIGGIWQQKPKVYDENGRIVQAFPDKGSITIG
jgi:hypothetical protein